MRGKKHMTWEGREYIRDALQQAAARVLEASKRADDVGDSRYVSGVVNALRGRPSTDGRMDGVIHAYRTLHELTRNAVHDESIHIDLIRTVVHPIVGRESTIENA